MKRKLNLDQLGICASIFCVIHCLAIPILLILGADAILIWLQSESLELVLIGLSLLIGLFSFIRGYLRHKQHFIPLLFVTGFLQMINGESVHDGWYGIALSIFGAVIIIYAHFYNHKLKSYAA